MRIHAELWIKSQLNIFPTEIFDALVNETF